MSKNSLFLSTVLVTGLLSLSAHADGISRFKGSDTMAGIMTDAIFAAGLNNEIVYEGGGSGLGETALVNGEQGIAPMSRAMKADAVNALKVKGVEAVGHVVALDGIGVFVNDSNSATGIDLGTLKQVYTCQLTKWEKISGSNKTGDIKVYRRNDASGTTDTFKNLVGVKDFGACVQVLAETTDIAEKTATEANAIGYSGATAKKDGNVSLSIAATPTSKYVPLNVNTVRSFEYPLARKLFIYEVKGNKSPNSAEDKLLNSYLLDRSFLDPIVQDHEFYTID
jgi:phosphate transport system substrate-binding protein